MSNFYSVTVGDTLVTATAEARFNSNGRDVWYDCESYYIAPFSFNRVTVGRWEYQALHGDLVEILADEAHEIVNRFGEQPEPD